MQLPQLYRRGVVRPLDDGAAQQLAEAKVRGPIRVEWLAVTTDEDFVSIWESGVLQRINDACGTEISDYEEVELESSKICEALSAIDACAVTDSSISAFVDSLRSLLSEAMATNRSVYFVF